MPSQNSQSAGELYIVATPIGNLADMVPRAVETLQHVDLIAAEDTRHSRRLLEHFHISTPMVAYHDFNEQRSTPSLLAHLSAGKRIALISDAGTPLIADPGYKLVYAARAAGIKVVPIPGPCALVAALCASGLPSDRFVFEGFLPAKPAQRLKRLQGLAREPRTLVLYEAPHRLLDSLRSLTDVFGSTRQVVLARELTKTFETFYSGTVAEVLTFAESDSNQQKGEIVLVVAGAETAQPTEVDDHAADIMRHLLAELSLKQASSLTAKITGVNKKMLYQWGVENQTRPKIEDK